MKNAGFQRRGRAPPCRKWQFWTIAGGIVVGLVLAIWGGMALTTANGGDVRTCPRSTPATVATERADESPRRCSASRLPLVLGAGASSYNIQVLDIGGAVVQSGVVRRLPRCCRSPHCRILVSGADSTNFILMKNTDETCPTRTRSACSSTELRDLLPDDQAFEPRRSPNMDKGPVVIATARSRSPSRARRRSPAPSSSRRGRYGALRTSRR